MKRAYDKCVIPSKYVIGQVVGIVVPEGLRRRFHQRTGLLIVRGRICDAVGLKALLTY